MREEWYGDKVTAQLGDALRQALAARADDQLLPELRARLNENNSHADGAVDPVAVGTGPGSLTAALFVEPLERGEVGDTGIPLIRIGADHSGLGPVVQGTSRQPPHPFIEETLLGPGQQWLDQAADVVKKQFGQPPSS
jgi:hypothetical protein